MNATRRQLKTQYDRAKRLGWLPYFQEAAEKHTKGYFDAADLMGIASRETNLDPKWLTKAGDGGNGFGLMQADKRSFPEFTKGDGWKDARTGILFGAKVVMQKLKDFRMCVGVTATVKSSKNGRSYSFTCKDAEGVMLQRIVIAAYNAGRWPFYAYSKDQPVDKYTTGADYSGDVMERAAAFRDFLKQDSAVGVQPVAEQPSTPQNDSKAQTRSTETPSDAMQAAPTGSETQTPPPNTDNTATITPESVNLYVPTIKRAARWLSTLSVAGTVTTAWGAFNGLPPWVVLIIGFITGIATIAIIALIWKQWRRVSKWFDVILKINADPNTNSVALVDRPEQADFQPPMK